jgi:integrase
MPKLRPGLKKLPSGNWQGRLRIGGKVLTTSHPERSEVEKWLDHQETRRSRNAYGEDPLAERTPVGDLWEKYRKRKLKPRTLKRYESLWNQHLGPRWATTPVCDIKRWMVQDWIDDLTDTTAAIGTERTLSPSTIEGCTVLLSGILKLAMERDMITVHPVHGVKRPEVTTPDLVLPTETELFALIDALPVNLRAMAVFGAAAGERYGEAAGMKRGDTDLDAGTALVDDQLHPDGSRGIPKQRGAGHYAIRTAPLPRWAVDYLRAILAERPKLPDALWSTGPVGGMVHRKTWDTAWRKAQETVYGTDRGMTHKVLRHWYISVRDDAGNSEVAIQRTVGHRRGSKVTKASYTHPSDRADELARAALDAAYARGTRVAKGSEGSESGR